MDNSNKDIETAKKYLKILQKTIKNLDQLSSDLHLRELIGINVMQVFGNEPKQ